MSVRKSGFKSRSSKAASVTGVLRDLLRNLRGGVAAVCFFRADARAWVASPPQLVALAVFGLAVAIVLNRTFFGAAAEFNWYQLRGLAFDLLLFLLVGWLAARGARKPALFLLLGVGLYAVSPVLDTAIAALWHLERQLLDRTVYSYWAQLVIYYGAYLWLLLVAFVLVRRVARLAYRHAAIAVLPVVIAAVFGIAFPTGPLWYEIPAGETASASRVARESPVTEEMLYLQPQLMQSQLRALAPHRRGVADLYFVAFAPHAPENVFMKESELIRNLMDERFDTRGRSLLLVNNGGALRNYPLATVTNLRSALRRIAGLMSREEDVLVLYLTSHGSKEHKLSAQYWPLQLEEVQPALLKSLLDESGIKWRVVVVSACYAGGFVDPLRGPTTLVMTAADATHTSFGCGAQSEITYFAKALFDEQLRRTHSFEQAFQQAIPLIREREAQQREEFSNPQIAVGEGIRRKLGQVERRLAATAR